MAETQVIFTDIDLKFGVVVAESHCNYRYIARVADLC